jgi:hypothetical protein
MKLLPLLVVLVACNQKQTSPPAAVGSAAPMVSPGSAAPVEKPPSPPPANDLCRIGIDAIDHAKCGSAESSLQSARKSLDTIVSTAQQTGISDPHAYEVSCARLVDAIDHDATKAGCTLSIDVPTRTTIRKDVDEYYDRRTPVTKTGDAAADEIIAKVAAVRDAACACKDQKCIDGLDKQLVAIPPMPATAPPAAHDLGTKLADEAGRCAQRIKLMQ